MSEDVKVETGFCPGCRKRRPLADFCGVTLDYDPQAPDPMLCEGCRRGENRVLPEPVDIFENLALEERVLLHHLAQGCSVAKAARNAGIGETRAHQLIRGERKPVVRAAYQALLAHAGLTPDVIAKGMAECASATKHQWHPKLEDFTEFPDWTVRLNTLKEAAKQHEIAEAPHAGKGTTVVNAIHIHTNLDSEERPEDASDGSFTIDIEAVSSVPSD